MDVAGFERNGDRRWWVLAAWLVIIFAVGLTGSWVTLPKIATWYATIAKPGFTPPNAVFGPVWTTLYVLMSVAAWRISSAPVGPRRRTALTLFVGQLALNGLWSPAFFGLESPRLGLVVIVPLLAVLAATVVAFWRMDRLAGGLLLPYLLWVGYATALNVAVVALN
jgi:translocator protein